MTELKPCPFCGGRGRISFKQYMFIGRNDFDDKKIFYHVQVICNRCKSTGKPIRTKPLINTHLDSTKWGNRYYEYLDVCRSETDTFEPYVNKAIEAWNRREQ